MSLENQTGPRWRQEASVLPHRRRRRPRSPRDGRFIEKIGTYNPLLPKDSDQRVVMDQDRAKHWLSVGAKPTDRVLRFLDAAGLMKREPRNNPQKASARQEAPGA